jgi:octaprenyl-diphosphate synthase
MTEMAVIVPFESAREPSIDPLVDLVAADMERVNTTIIARTGSEVTMIPEVANHLINSGGKRLRPMLTLALSRLAGYGGDGHIKLAAAVEFMHTATLLHDDVVDESELRRGRMAARMLWGNEASVLVGDFLLGQAFKMMVEVGSLKALEILSAAAAVIAEGEVMQLAAAKNTATTEDEYIAVIRAKTAELFAAACEVGPAISGRQKPLLWNESGHHFSACRRCARLWRRLVAAWQEHRRRFSRRQDYLAGGARVPPRQRCRT